MGVAVRRRPSFAEPVEDYTTHPWLATGTVVRALAERVVEERLTCTVAAAANSSESSSSSSSSGLGLGAMAKDQRRNGGVGAEEEQAGWASQAGGFRVAFQHNVTKEVSPRNRSARTLSTLWVRVAPVALEGATRRRVNRQRTTVRPTQGVRMVGGGIVVVGGGGGGANFGDLGGGGGGGGGHYDDDDDDGMMFGDELFCWIPAKQLDVKELEALVAEAAAAASAAAAGDDDSAAKNGNSSYSNSKSKSKSNNNNNNKNASNSDGVLPPVPTAVVLAPFEPFDKSQE